MERMSLTTGGKTYQLVTEQARRISGCRLTFFTDRENGAESRRNGAFVQDAISLSGVVDDEQPTLWQDRVRLDEGFWRSLRDHPVPVREEAIKATRNSQSCHRYLYLAGLSVAHASQDNRSELDSHSRPVWGRFPSSTPNQTDLHGCPHRSAC